ncbi:mRNA surveillance protein pelota, partial [Candidatus Bathyarchaeota archaeon]|nr:mRNA surveillance protein pelota [Candidatus Bathyarchaeota archaeon]
VHGIICQAPEIVPTGAHHTLNINLNSPLTIVKKHWARHHLERLETAEKASGKPIIIVAVDDDGYAIALTAHYGLNVKVEEHFSLPGKGEAEKRGEAVKAFFRKALNSLRQVWSETHAPIAVIGVGFLKNDFVKYVEKEASSLAKAIVDVKSVNNSGVAGIYEALRSGVLAKTMHYLRVLDETEVMEEVLKRLGRNERNVAYGLEDVRKADDMGAVETLLVADTLLRESPDEQRLSIEDVMKSVEVKGGKTMVISTEHEAGEKLLALGGIAALLRFQLPEQKA